VAANTGKPYLFLAWLAWLLGLGLCFGLLLCVDQGGGSQPVSQLPVNSEKTISAPDAARLPQSPPSLLTPPEVNALLPTLNNRGRVEVAPATDTDSLAAFHPPPPRQAEAPAADLTPNPEEIRQKIAAKQQEMIDDAAFQAALRKYEAALAQRQAKRQPEQVPAAGWGPLINKYARQHGVDARLVWAVMRHESGFNPNAVSPKGAMGLMQLIPSTAALLGVTDPFNPEENISGGVRYLKICLTKFNNNVVWALAAYNAGPDNVSKYQGVPPFAETRSYVLKIMRDYTGTWIDLPLPPPAAGLARRQGTESGAPGGQTPVAPQPSGPAWKIPTATFKVAKPTWKIPLATTILANRLPAQVRQHPEVIRLLAKKANQKPVP